MNKITTQAEYDQRYPNVPIERWTNNVVDAVLSIGNREHHVANWFREDRPAWENPNEAVNILMDDCVFELFLQDCDYSLTEQQRRSGHLLMQELNLFLETTPKFLDSAETFSHPQWLIVQSSANDFVSRFTKS
jgi:hypothetical protein